MTCARHQWVRYPVVAFEVEYGCRDCGLKDYISWNPNLMGKGFEAADAVFEGMTGGIVVSRLDLHGMEVPL